jgi:hypothetical protein
MSNALSKFNLWFFRDLSDNQRQALFKLFQLPESQPHEWQKRCLGHVLADLAANGTAPSPEAREPAQALPQGGEAYPELAEAAAALGDHRPFGSHLPRATPEAISASGAGVPVAFVTEIAEGKTLFLPRASLSPGLVPLYASPPPLEAGKAVPLTDEQIEAMCRESFDNTFHKIKALMSYDQWRVAFAAGIKRGAQ